MTQIHGDQIRPYTINTNYLVSGVVPSGSFTNANITVSGGMIIAAANGIAGSGGVGETTVLYDNIGITISSEVAITTGNKGLKQIPYTSEIMDWTIITDATGTISYSLEKCEAVEYPTFIDMISTGTAMKSNNAVNNQNANFNNWVSTGFTAGDIVRFGVASVVGDIREAYLMMRIRGI